MGNAAGWLRSRGLLLREHGSHDMAADSGRDLISWLERRGAETAASLAREAYRRIGKARRRAGTAKLKGWQQASHEKRSEQAHARAKQPSQEPQSDGAGVRIERPRRENPRQSVSHCREISPARARRAVLRRPGRGRKLLSARRALFPPDRGRAGAIPAEQSALHPRRERDAADAATTMLRRGDEATLGQPADGSAASDRLRHARAAALYSARCASRFRSTQPHTAPAASAAPRRRSRIAPTATSTGCRPSSPAGSSRPHPPRHSPRSRQNGHDGQADRFPLHRRRRRHRGPRHGRPGRRRTAATRPSRRGD